MAEDYTFRRLPEQQISDAEPFSDDRLDRRNCAENLTRFVRSCDSGFVLAVSAPWGGGKTFFVKRWQAMLERGGFSTVYHNAWEQDYVDSPLLAIVAALQQHVDAQQNDAQGSLQAASRKLGEGAKKLARIAGRAAIEYATRGALSAALGQESVEADTLAKIAGAWADDALAVQKSTSRMIAEFKSHLRDFAAASSSAGQPLVVFIDELDRCTPAYTVDFLEALKHLLAVEHVVFVLAIDREQLLRTVDAMFGCGKTNDGYLRRFVDYTFYLPEPDLAAFCDANYDRLAFSSAKDNTFGEYGRDLVKRWLPAVAQTFGFSLRQVEHYMHRMWVISRMSDQPKWWCISDSLALLAAFVESDPATYRRLMAGTGIESASALADWASQRVSGSVQMSAPISEMAGTLVAVLTGGEHEHIGCEIGERFDRTAFDEAHAKVRKGPWTAGDAASIRRLLARLIDMTGPA